MSLADDMRAAADTLDAVCEHWGWDTLLPNLDPITWTPSALRRGADIVDAENCEAAEREAIIEELTDALHGTNGCVRSTNRRSAAILVDSGWRKGDPE